MRQRLGTGRIVLAVSSLLIVAGTGGCGSDRETTRSDPRAPAPKETPSPAQWRMAKKAESALAKRGGLISGQFLPATFGDGVTCTPRVDGTNVVDCEFGQGDGMESSWIEVQVQPDGSLSKALGSPDPVSGQKSSEQTAALLASDDYVNHAPSRTRDYTCHRSPRVERDGSRAPTSASGQLCTTHLRVSRKDIQRYIEFTRDGFVARDYVLDDA